jgi:hypothetical protein
VQLVALQLLQELPVNGTVSPLSLREKEAQAEIVRSAFLWQRGQEAFLSDSLKERSNSNFKPHSEQTYSYIGISLTPGISLSYFWQASQA